MIEIRSVVPGDAEEQIVSFSTSHDAHLFELNLQELLPLLDSLLEARTSAQKVLESGDAQKSRAVLATIMKAEVEMHQLTSFIGQIPDLAAGDISAHELGFPEFDDGGFPID